MGVTIELLCVWLYACRPLCSAFELQWSVVEWLMLAQGLGGSEVRESVLRSQHLLCYLVGCGGGEVGLPWKYGEVCLYG